MQTLLLTEEQNSGELGMSNANVDLYDSATSFRRFSAKGRLKQEHVMGSAVIHASAACNWASHGPLKVSSSAIVFYAIVSRFL